MIFKTKRKGYFENEKSNERKEWYNAYCVGITNTNRNPGKKGAFWLGSGSGGMLKAVNSSGGLANEVGWNYGGYRCSSNYYI